MKRTVHPANGVPQTRGDALRRLVRTTYARAAARAAEVVPGTRPATCMSHSGLGCGSPTAFARLAAGEWVLDLGSGAGFDCLAAAVEVGRGGCVVGIDMTPDMVRLARRHAAEAGVAFAHFVQAEIERLPFRDATFDVVISNCVINLCADKQRVLAEACRVLKPNGRLAVADIVAVAPLPASALENLALHTGCVAGAMPLDLLSRLLRSAGFASGEIDIGEHGSSLLDTWAPGLDLGRFVAAASIVARKHPAFPTRGGELLSHASARAAS
jgi:SAM-dependent methyltransferase